MKSTRPLSLLGALQVWIIMLISLPVAAQEEGGNFFPLEYVENKGQWPGDFQYRAVLGGANIYLKKNGFRFLLLNKDDMRQIEAFRHGQVSTADTVYNPDGGKYIPPASKPGAGTNPVTAPEKVRGHSYDLEFLNTLPNPQVTASKPTQENISYFIGKDPSSWRSGVSAYTNVLYTGLYKNVDMQVYSESGQMKYDLIVHPGGDPSQIRFQYSGATGVKLVKGNLHIQTSVGDAVELMPFAYQYINNERKEVTVRYQLSGNTVSFKVSGKYDSQYPLVIDPTVVFATLSGSRSDNWGFTATYDAQGNFYGGGIAFDAGYPTSAGAYDQTFNGGEYDMAITKFNAAGTRIIYSAYIGGQGQEQPHSLFVDGQGNLVISGRTNSANFPVFPQGNTHGPLGGYDITVTKLNATGTGIIGSMRIGGSNNDACNMRSEKGGVIDQLLRNYGDDARSEVVIDGAGNIYIASSTQSPNFPTTPGVLQPTFGGGRQDAVVLKINPNANALLWSTFLGGSDADAAYVLAVNGGNSVYVAGGTASANFPTTAGTVYAGYRGGACDGYITHIATDGSSILQSTFLGSDNGKADQVYGIQLDRVGDVYVMGTTEGTWPIQQPAGTATFYNDNSKQFITKLRPDLTSLIYSTTFGTTQPMPSLSPVAFLVDRCQNVYVSGWGGALNSGFRSNTSTHGLRVTPDARKPTTDGSDFYFFVMKRDALDILYGTFYGGNELAEHVDGGTSRFDQNGVIYQGICAACPNPTRPRLRFPTTPGAYNSGIPRHCNLGALKIAFNLDGVRAGFTTQERRNNFCLPPDNITFIDTTNVTAQSWRWDFGDGSQEVTTTVPTVSHLFPNQVGDYTVRLIKYDPGSCNVYDTAFMPIRFRNDRADVGFTDLRVQPPCYDLLYRFTNTSNAPAGKPFTDKSFTWDYGDGTPVDTTDGRVMEHRYQSEGIYNVTLTLIDTNYCNAPQSVSRQIRVAANVVAAFTLPDSACAPFTANIDNISKGGVSFLWTFGDDGSTSTDIYPVHTFTQPGLHSVRLEVEDPNTCNVRHDTTMQILILPPPAAAFSFQPTKPVENTPTTFTNESTGADSYWWDFGDGTTSTERDPTYQYLRTGTYEVCLIATTKFGCQDTVCQTVSAIVNPLYDVPTAFSPNGDGINDKWEIKGFGIVKYDMKVFNRWGQLMFQSNDQKLGWDGRFNGAVQAMDAYAFVLNIEFSDGTRVSKTGNVTLLR